MPTDKLDPELRNFLDQCLQVDRNVRATADDLLKLRFLLHTGCEDKDNFSDGSIDRGLTAQTKIGFKKL